MQHLKFPGQLGPRYDHSASSHRKKRGGCINKSFLHGASPVILVFWVKALVQVFFSLSVLGWLTHSTMPPASYLLALKLNPHLSFLKLGLGSSCASYSKLPWQPKGCVGGGRVRVVGFGGKGLARCVPTTCGEGLHMPSYNHVISFSPLYFFKSFWIAPASYNIPT